MTIENLVCGIIGSIVAAIIITIASKVYLGVSGFRGLKNTVRLIRDSYKGGIVNIFPNRKSYIQHKDHGTETQYISKCKSKLMYIGYWLAHGTPLNASAFLIDYDSKKEMRILVDYKIYNQEREKSYGIEYMRGSITQSLWDSYQEISRNAKVY